MKKNNENDKGMYEAINILGEYIGRTKKSCDLMERYILVIKEINELIPKLIEVINKGNDIEEEVKKLASEDIPDAYVLRDGLTSIVVKKLTEMEKRKTK